MAQWIRGLWLLPRSSISKANDYSTHLAKSIEIYSKCTQQYPCMNFKERYILNFNESSYPYRFELGSSLTRIFNPLQVNLNINTISRSYHTFLPLDKDWCSSFDEKESKPKALLQNVAIRKKRPTFVIRRYFGKKCSGKGKKGKGKKGKKDKGKKCKKGKKDKGKGKKSKKGKGKKCKKGKKDKGKGKKGKKGIDPKKVPEPCANKEKPCTERVGLRQKALKKAAKKAADKASKACQRKVAKKEKCQAKGKKKAKKDNASKICKKGGKDKGSDKKKPDTSKKGSGKKGPATCKKSGGKEKSDTSKKGKKEKDSKGKGPVVCKKGGAKAEKGQTIDPKGKEKPGKKSEDICKKLKTKVVETSGAKMPPADKSSSCPPPNNSPGQKCPKPGAAANQVRYLDESKKSQTGSATLRLTEHFYASWTYKDPYAGECFPRHPKDVCVSEGIHTKKKTKCDGSGK